MAKKGNFVYIHRKIMDWEWYKDPNTFRVFLHLILRANWKPHEIQRPTNYARADFCVISDVRRRA